MLRKEWYTWFIKKYNASAEKKEDKLDVGIELTTEMCTFGYLM